MRDSTTLKRYELADSLIGAPTEAPMGASNRAPQLGRGLAFPDSRKDTGRDPGHASVRSVGYVGSVG
jgi:hypothetical protein